jgi:nucleoside-diphosphate-sugar epimerase
MQTAETQRTNEEWMEARNGSKQQEDFEWIAANFDAKEQFKDATIFVTGGTGFIGSYLVKSLLCYNRIHHLNLKVVAMVRSKEKVQRIYGKLQQREELSFAWGDLRERLAYEGEIDYILHTAAVTTSKQMVDAPVDTIDIAYQGTRNVLEFAREKQAKGVVYLSSMEVYGTPDASLEWVREKDLGYVDLTNVRSSYPQGKRISESLCMAYAAQYQLPVKIARLAQTFGAGVLPEDNRVYVQFSRSAMQEQDIVLHTTGCSEGNYCYVRDVACALMMLLYTGIQGEAYNLVNEDTHMQIRQMAQLVADEVAKGKIKVQYDLPESALTYGYAPEVKMRLSGEKMRALGWQPQVGLAQMYERMIADMQMGEA